MKTNYDELKEKNDGLESELEHLKGHIIQQHINVASTDYVNLADDRAKVVEVDADVAA